MKTTVVCIGDNCIDEYMEPVNQKFIGGNALNVAVYLQRGGVSTAYIGAVGNDPTGRWILEDLRKIGIDVDYVQTHPSQTARSLIRISPSGDREFVHEDLGPKDCFKLSSKDLAFISRHRLVHNTFLGNSEAYLADFKRSPGLLISFDYGERCPAELLNSTIRLVDLAFFSLPETQWHEAKSLATEIFSLGPKIVVVTVGSQGSIVYDGQFYIQAAFPVNVIDTLGAGDTYIGTFLAGYLMGISLPECMLNASYAAAQTCTHLGAWVMSEKMDD